WSCVSTGGGGGLADPGANGVMTRTALNVTAPADAAAMAKPVVASAVGGTADAITITLVPALAAQTQVGTVVRFTPGANNATTTPTAAVSGLTALTIKKKGTSGLVAVAANDIVSGESATLELDPSVTFWTLTNPQTSSGAGLSGLTTGYIPQATSTTTIGNTSPILDNSVTTANTLTYAGSAGLTLSAAGAVAKVGASAPAPTVGTGGGGLAVEGSTFTPISGDDGWYANSTTHAVDIVNGLVDQGAAATVTHGNGFTNFATSQFSQATSAAQAYYIPGSALTVPSTLYNGYIQGTTWEWHVDGIVKNGNGTGATSFIVYSGTNGGTTSDTAEITQAWGTAGTAVADVAHLDVVCIITGIVSGTATVYCGISPEHHLATTGWVTTAVGGYGGTFTFNTATSGLTFGLGFSVASGGTLPTVTIASVSSKAINLN